MKLMKKLKSSAKIDQDLLNNIEIVERLQQELKDKNAEIERKTRLVDTYKKLSFVSDQAIADTVRNCVPVFSEQHDTVIHKRLQFSLRQCSYQSDANSELIKKIAELTQECQQKDNHIMNQEMIISQMKARCDMKDNELDEYKKTKYVKLDKELKMFKKEYIIALTFLVKLCSSISVLTKYQHMFVKKAKSKLAELKRGKKSLMDIEENEDVGLGDCIDENETTDSMSKSSVPEITENGPKSPMPDKIALSPAWSDEGVGMSPQLSELSPNYTEADSSTKHPTDRSYSIESEHSYESQSVAVDLPVIDIFSIGNCTGDKNDMLLINPEDLVDFPSEFLNLDSDEFGKEIDLPLLEPSTSGNKVNSLFDPVKALEEQIKTNSNYSISEKKMCKTGSKENYEPAENLVVDKENKSKEPEMETDDSNICNNLLNLIDSSNIETSQINCLKEKPADICKVIALETSEKRVIELLPTDNSEFIKNNNNQQQIKFSDDSQKISDCLNIDNSQDLSKIGLANNERSATVYNSINLENKEKRDLSKTLLMESNELTNSKNIHDKTEFSVNGWKISDCLKTGNLLSNMSNSMEEKNISKNCEQGNKKNNNSTIIPISKKSKRNSVKMDKISKKNVARKEKKSISQCELFDLNNAEKTLNVKKCNLQTSSSKQAVSSVEKSDLKTRLKEKLHPFKFIESQNSDLLNEMEINKKKCNLKSSIAVNNLEEVNRLTVSSQKFEDESVEICGNICRFERPQLVNQNNKTDSRNKCQSIVDVVGTLPINLPKYIETSNKKSSYGFSKLPRCKLSPKVVDNDVDFNNLLEKIRNDVACKWPAVSPMPPSPLPPPPGSNLRINDPSSPESSRRTALFKQKRVPSKKKNNLQDSSYGSNQVSDLDNCNSSGTNEDINYILKQIRQEWSIPVIIEPIQYIEFKSRQTRLSCPSSNEEDNILFSSRNNSSISCCSERKNYKIKGGRRKSEDKTVPGTSYQVRCSERIRIKQIHINVTKQKDHTMPCNYVEGCDRLKESAENDSLEDKSVPGMCVTKRDLRLVHKLKKCKLKTGKSPLKENLQCNIVTNERNKNGNSIIKKCYLEENTVNNSLISSDILNSSRPELFTNTIGSQSCNNDTIQSSHNDQQSSDKKEIDSFEGNEPLDKVSIRRSNRLRKSINIQKRFLEDECYNNKNNTSVKGVCNEKLFNIGKDDSCKTLTSKSHNLCENKAILLTSESVPKPLITAEEGTGEEFYDDELIINLDEEKELKEEEDIVEPNKEIEINESQLKSKNSAVNSRLSLNNISSCEKVDENKFPLNNKSSSGSKNKSDESADEGDETEECEIVSNKFNKRHIPIMSVQETKGYYLRSQDRVNIVTDNKKETRGLFLEVGSKAITSDQASTNEPCHKILKQNIVFNSSKVSSDDLSSHVENSQSSHKESSPTFGFYMDSNSSEIKKRKTCEEEEEKYNCKKPKFPVSFAPKECVKAQQDQRVLFLERLMKKERISCENIVEEALSYHRHKFMAPPKPDKKKRNQMEANEFKTIEIVLSNVQNSCSANDKWTSELLESSINELRMCREKSISRRIVDLLYIDQGKPEESTLLPPLTPLQKRLITIAYKLCKDELYPTFLSTMIGSVKSFMFVTTGDAGCNLDGLCKIARFLTILCRSQGATMKMRSFMYDMLYMKQLKAYPIIYEILTMWPQIMPLAGSSDAELPLWYCIRHLLISHNVVGNKIQRFKIYQLTQMLKSYYNYNTETPNSDEVLKELLNKFPQRGAVEAIVLLCKKVGQKWTLDTAMNKFLLPMLEAYENGFLDNITSSLVIETTGLVLRTFIQGNYNPVIKNIINKFGNILASKEADRDVQEAAAIGICRLSRTLLPLCIEKLLKWRPHNEEVAVDVIQRMKPLIAKKKPVWWQMVLASNSCEETV